MKICPEGKLDKKKTLTLTLTADDNVRSDGGDDKDYSNNDDDDDDFH
jgi:hypothetical protein